MEVFVIKKTVKYSYDNSTLLYYWTGTTFVGHPPDPHRELGRPFQANVYKSEKGAKIAITKLKKFLNGYENAAITIEKWS